MMDNLSFEKEWNWEFSALFWPVWVPGAQECINIHSDTHACTQNETKRSLEKIDETDLIISLSNSNVPTYHYLIMVKHASKPVQLFPVKGKLNRALAVDHFGSLCLRSRRKVASELTKNSWTMVFFCEIISYYQESDQTG